MPFHYITTTTGFCVNIYLLPYKPIVRTTIADPKTQHKAVRLEDQQGQKWIVATEVVEDFKYDGWL